MTKTMFVEELIKQYRSKMEEINHFFKDAHTIIDMFGHVHIKKTVVKDLAIKVVSNNPEVLTYDEVYQDEEIAKMVLKKGYENFKFIKKEFQNPDLCLEAIRLSQDNFKYVAICSNSTLEETKKNLNRMAEILNNKKLVRTTVREI